MDLFEGWCILDLQKGFKEFGNNHFNVMTMTMTRLSHLECIIVSTVETSPGIGPECQQNNDDDDDDGDGDEDDEDDERFR